MPEELQRKIQFGDTSAGWEGNPNMYLATCRGRACQNNFCAGFVLAQSMDNGKTAYIAHSKAAKPTADIIRMLTQRSKQTSDELVDEVIANNDAVAAERERHSDAVAHEAANRLYDNLRKNS